MGNNNKRNESGQAIVLITLGMVVLLAFVALAVDGGMVLYDRRSAQNAADAAALAGGFVYAKNPWTTTSLDICGMANARAGDNNYGGSAGPTTAATGTVFTCTYTSADGKIVVITLPNPLPANPGPEYPIDVKVDIQSPVKTSFVQLVFQGQIKNNVEAVAHIKPPRRGPPFSGSGLVSLSMTGCGIKLSGTANNNLYGGGIYANSSDSGAICGASGAAQTYAPFVDVVGTIDSSVKGTSLLVPNPSVNQVENYSPQLPYPPGIVGMPSPPFSVCSGPASAKIKTGITSYLGPNGNQIFKDANGAQLVDTHGNPIPFDEYTPGVISSDISSIIPNGGGIYLDPGTYCFTKGFDLQNNQVIYGYNVFIYVANSKNGSNACNFTWSGSAQINLAGAGNYLDGSTLNPSPTSEQYKGMLLYIQSYTPPSTVSWTIGGNNSPSLAGTQSSTIIGTLYAPTCNIQLNGTGGDFYQGQVIGYTDTISGNQSFMMNYDSHKNVEVQQPSNVDLSK